MDRATGNRINGNKESRARKSELLEDSEASLMAAIKNGYEIAGAIGISVGTTMPT
jgi:hypothetical protein